MYMDINLTVTQYLGRFQQGRPQQDRLQQELCRMEVDDESRATMRATMTADPHSHEPQSGLMADLMARGLVHQVSNPALGELLEKEAFTLYVGFDPTAPSLHVGNLLQLVTLRRFQLAGHRPIVVLGGGTALVGDPSGKSQERPLLSRDQVKEHGERIRPQLERFLDFSDGAGSRRALLVDNTDWLGETTLLDFLRDVGKHFTVGQMVAKESVRTRMERPEQGMSFTEFAYMLLQAYDFLQLWDRHGCRLQMGASDQWGNITMGIELIRKTRSGEAFGLTTPLLTDENGMKLGKTDGAPVWLDPDLTTPYQFYQYFLRLSDSLALDLVEKFSFLGAAERQELRERFERHPEDRAVQRLLAREMTLLVHGQGQAEAAERASGALFGSSIADLGEDEMLVALQEAPAATLQRSVLDPPGLPIADLLVAAGLASSKGAARRLAAQGGVYLNDERVGNPEQMVTSANLLHGRYLVLRKGKKDYALAEFA
jgi:tyrosyl-tRNA synthetase